MASEAQLHELLDIAEQAKREGDDATFAKVSAAYKAASAPKTAPDLFSMMDPYGGGVDMSDPATQAAVTRATKGAGMSIARAPLNLAEGAGQLVTHAGNAVGLVSDADEKAYDDAVKQSRADFEKAGGNVAFSELVSGAIPVGGQAKLLTSGTKYVYGLIKAAGLGSVLSASTFADDGDKKSQAVLGAALPALAQAVGGLAPTAANGIKNLLDKAQTGRTAQMLKDARGFFSGSPAVDAPAPYTLGQSTGNARVASLENRARGPVLQELNATQLDEASARFEELATQAGRMGAKAMTRESFTATKELTDAAKRSKNAMWQKGMSEFNALAAGSKVGVRLDNLKAEYGAIAAEDANIFSLEGGVIGGEAKAAFDALSKMPPTAKLKLAVLPTIMKGLGTGSDYGKSAIMLGDDAKRAMYRGRLFSALEKDLDTAGAAGDPALTKLTDVRTRYRAASAKLERLEDSNLNALFGSKEALANPRAAVSKFLSLPPEDQEYTLRVLNQRAPAVVAGMQSQRISDALEAASENTAANQSVLNIDKFNANLFGGSDGIKGSRLFDPELKKRLLQGAAHLRVLQNNLPKGGSALVWPEEIAINLVSRSPEFVARTATRLVYGMHGDKLLGTPQGIASLKTLSNVKAAKPQAVAQAVAYLTDLANDEAASESPQ